MENHLSQTYKAQRCTVDIGNISLTVFYLPDSSYQLSQSEVSGIIDKPARSIFEFLRSKRLQALLDEDSKFSNFQNVPVEGSQKPITPIPIEMALLYWYKWAQQGNKKALALVIALAKRSIYEAADEALGINRRKQESERIFEDDLSDQGIARLHVMYQSLEQQMFDPAFLRGHVGDPQPEHQSERELKLKIRLAELEVERERLHLSKNSNGFPVKDIDQLGAAPWVIIPWTQKTLGWSDANATLRLLGRLGYGLRSKQWFKVKVTGDLWVMPWSTFKDLSKAVEQFKSERK